MKIIPGRAQTKALKKYFYSGDSQLYSSSVQLWITNFVFAKFNLKRLRKVIKIKKLLNHINFIKKVFMVYKDLSFVTF